ncbi:unnamed protein product [Prunus armeniaca]|uniref:Uncharacterized protein n=1 Tax=Prunus armeniaca TaxID=36596 RepID=A0A6J5V2Y0_PRUAR|nr:unnamed protein product [Prunus armeniaca]
MKAEEKSGWQDGEGMVSMGWEWLLAIGKGWVVVVGCYSEEKSGWQDGEGMVSMGWGWLLAMRKG